MFRRLDSLRKSISTFFSATLETENKTELNEFLDKSLFSCKATDAHRFVCEAAHNDPR